MIGFDKFFSIAAYIYRQKKFPRLFHPKTLTEKILFIKLRPGLNLAKLRRIAADRIRVREYVEQKHSGCGLIPLLWTGTDFNLSIWNSLPRKFVIKANHGSKMVYIVDKSKDQFSDILEYVRQWKSVDYYKKGREWVYKELDRTLLVEKFIDFNKEVPPDFKFFCLNGIVQFVQVDSNRFTNHTRNIYNESFELLPVQYEFPKGEVLRRPSLYDKAVEIAQVLSKDFDFIRVDLYILDNIIYFGELTNFPGNCLEKFNPLSFDEEMGSKLIVNKAK